MGTEIRQKISNPSGAFEIDKLSSVLTVEQCQQILNSDPQGDLNNYTPEVDMCAQSIIKTERL